MTKVLLADTQWDDPDEAVEDIFPQIDIQNGLLSHSDSAAGADRAGLPEGGITIDGIDTEYGILMTGGTAQGYLRVLSSWLTDARERIGILPRYIDGLKDSDDSAAFALFTTQVHALKSASASIGAASIARAAKALEEAGKQRSGRIIAEKLPGFVRELQKTADTIEAALAARRGTRNGEPCGIKTGAAAELLAGLSDALKKEEVERIDRILAALDDIPLCDATRETIIKISDNVLMAEFSEALKLSGLLLAEAGTQGQT